MIIQRTKAVLSTQFSCGALLDDITIVCACVCVCLCVCVCVCVQLVTTKSDFNPVVNYRNKSEA